MKAHWVVRSTGAAAAAGLLALGSYVMTAWARACDVSLPLRGRLRRTSALCRDGRVSLFGEGSSFGDH